MDFLTPHVSPEFATPCRTPDEEEASTPCFRTRKSARFVNSEISSLFSPSCINEMKVSVALKYGNWVNEFINDMRASLWPEALTSLRYLYYVGKQPGEYDSALSSREAAVAAIARLPNGFELVFQFLLYTLDELRPEITISGISNGKNERKKTLFSLLRHIACILCQQGFDNAYSASKIQFIEYFTKVEQIDISEWTRLVLLADIAQATQAAPRQEVLSRDESENERPLHSITDRVKDNNLSKEIAISHKQPKRPALSPMRVSNGLSVVLVEAKTLPSPPIASVPNSSQVRNIQ